MSKRIPGKSRGIEKNSRPSEIESFASQDLGSETTPRPRNLQNLVDTHNLRRMRNSYPDTYSQLGSSTNQKISPQDQVRRLSSILYEQRRSNEEFKISPPRVSNQNRLNINSTNSTDSSPEAPQIISSMARLRLDQASKAESPPTPQGLLRKLVKSIQVERLADDSEFQEVVRDKHKNSISQKPFNYSKHTVVSDSSSESHSVINLDDIETSKQFHNIEKFTNLAPADFSSIQNIEELSNLNIENQVLRDISIDITSTSNHIGFDLNAQNDLEDAQQILNNSLMFIGDDLDIMFPRDALPSPKKIDINIYSGTDVNHSSISNSVQLNNSLIDKTELSPNNDFNLSKFDEVGSSYKTQQILDLSGSDIASVDGEEDGHGDKKSADIVNISSSSHKFGNGDEDDLSMLERAFIEASANDRSDRSFGIDYLGEVDSDVDEKSQINMSSSVSKLNSEATVNKLDYSDEDSALSEQKIQSNILADEVNLKDSSYAIQGNGINTEIEASKQRTDPLSFDEFNSGLTDLNTEPEIDNSDLDKALDPTKSIDKVELESDTKATEPSLHLETDKETQNANDEDIGPNDVADQSAGSEQDEEPEIDTTPQEDLIQTPSVSSEPSESSLSSDIEAADLQPDEEPENESEPEPSGEFEIIGTADFDKWDDEIDNSAMVEPSGPADFNLDNNLVNEEINNQEANIDLSNNLNLRPILEQEESLLSANPPISPETSFNNNLNNLNNENDVIDQEINYSDISEGSIDNMRHGTSKPILSPVSPGTVPTIRKLPAYSKHRKIDFNQVSKSSASLNNLPASQVKSLVESMTNSRISSATLNSFLFATDKYFEQVSGDLLAYSKHAQRKVVNEDDVLCLFKRQNKIKNAEMGDFISLAQKQLPRDLWEPLAQPANPTKRRKVD